MKSAVENLEPTRVRLTVEVPYDELKPSVDAAYKQIALQVSIPGFRKGKVPPRIIDQRVGRAVVIEQAVNDALPSLYRRAVTEADIRPLGQPDVEVTGIPEVTGTGGDLSFTAEVDVRPEITLPDLGSLTITVDAAEVTDADVEDRLDSLRERFGTLVGVDRPAGAGDYVVLDLRATIDDEEIDSVSGVSYQIGSGTMLDGLDEALIGLSAGESATFSAPLAGGDHAGETAQITVTATAVKQRDLPEADDDFAQLASEFDTIEELRVDLRRKAVEAGRQEQIAEAQEALVEALLAAAEFPVPARVVEAEIEHHLEGEGRADDEQHRAEIRAEATQALRRQLLLDALADALAISVTQQELVEVMLRTAQQYNVDPSTFISGADEAGQIPAFVGELSRSKALVLALRQVAAVDSAGGPVDLSGALGPEAETVMPPVEDESGVDMPEDVPEERPEDVAEGVAPAQEADAEEAVAARTAPRA